MSRDFAKRPTVNGQELGLAQRVENLAADSRLHDDSPAEYPYGVSSMPSFDESNHDSFAYNWDTGAVETTRYISDDPYDHAIQVFKSANTGALAWRGWNGTGWEDWQAPVESGVFESHAHDHVTNLEADSRLYADPPTDYPLGISFMPTTDDSTAGKFAYEYIAGLVQTLRYYDEDTSQEWCNQALWAGSDSPVIRTWNPVGGVWSSFEMPAFRNWATANFAAISHEHDHVANLEADSRLSTDLPTAYPLGYSLMPVQDGDDPDSFPATWDVGEIETLHWIQPGTGLHLAKQRFMNIGPDMTYRFGGPSGWDDWRIVSVAGHVHDGRYYTETEVDDLIDGVSGGGPHAASHTDGTDQIANATTSAAGLESAADKTKLDGIETAATADMTPTEILNAIKTVDGSGSDLDADKLDGHDTAYFAVASDLAAKADLVGGLVPTSQIPGLAISDVFTVASQAAMLALTAQRGDIAVRTDFDPDRTYILSTDSPGTLADWVRVTFGDVVSVNGQTGVIVLGYADVGAASTSDTRIPTQDENDALGGTSGAPSSSNKYVTDGDARNTNARTPTAHATTHTNGADDIQNATASQKGVATAAQITKLDAIEAGATQDMTAAELRTAIAGGTISTNLLDLPEQASPGNPAADTGRLYAVDAGGKTEPEHRDSAGDARRIFRDSYFVAQNTTGGTLAKGTVVRVTSLVGTDIPIIASADADASSTMPAAGILMEAVTNNSYGRVMFQGVLTGIVTTGMTAGSPLYASGTAGGFTQTAPVYPAFRQVLGSVLSVGASGVLLVNVSHFFRQVGVPVSLPFFEGGTLTTKTGAGRYIITANMAGTITECRVAIDTAPTGASVIVGFRKNGAASFTTVTVAISANSGSSTGLSTAMAAGDYLTVDITQIGSTVAGSNLTAVAELMTAA